MRIISSNHKSPAGCIGFWRGFLIIMAATVFSWLPAYAFSPEAFAENSVLASGQWVKISVPESGVYRLTAANLRRWGFADPTKVRIFGYGGTEIPQLLNETSYIDDLPQVPVKADASGVVFYAKGPEKVVESSSQFLSLRRSIYSTLSYYFVTESDDPSPEVPVLEIAAAGAANPDRFFDCLVQHEQDLTAPGQCGPLLVGEDFKYTPSRRFSFNLTGLMENSNVNLECHFTAKTYSYESELAFSEGGKEIEKNNTNRIPPVSVSSDKWAQSSFIRNIFAPAGEKVDLTAEFRASSVVYGAWLDYIALTYKRKLVLPDSKWLSFNSTSAELALSGVKDSKSLNIWDVTSPMAVRSVPFSAEGEEALWKISSAGRRQYVAWLDGASLPEPAFVGLLPSQNLHAQRDLDMVIFSPAAYTRQAERVAEIHRAEGMNVLVADPEKVYNEFSSGAQDVCALRNFLKMLYDRGKGSDHQLKYALLIGRATYDNRHVSTEMASNKFPTLPIWYDANPIISLDPVESYGTDDFIGFLEDNSGRDLARDVLSVAVGRLPVTSLEKLRNYVDKLYSYISKSRKTTWKNHIMLLADDEEQGTFIKDLEKFTSELGDNRSDQFIFKKVYTDAYKLVNGVYPEGRRDMFRNFNEGVAWWFYVGHANDHSMTGEGQFTFSDINNNMYLRNLPFLFAATCNFLKWDAGTESGGEILFNERNGGVIGVISATRSAYITYNGYFLRSFGRQISKRDENGRLLPAGEIYRRAKNTITDNEGQTVYNSNKLRYVFMGDPAMHMVTPHNRIIIDNICGIAPGGDDDAVIMARQNVEIKGSVLSLDGNVDESFNGRVLIDLYDAEKSVTTFGRGNGSNETFEAHGDKLFSGSAVVASGRFTISFNMPDEITDNYRPALANLYAYTDEDSPREAISAFSDFYVFGYDDEAEEDNIAPVIEYMYINHEGFTPGATVNSTPMIIAKVTDNCGINVSSSGVGKMMNVLVDGKTPLNDVSFYYTPLSDGTVGGTIAYPMESLVDGNHTVRLRVWDTSGNMCEAETDFVTREGLPPELFDVYADSNPASEQTNFYLRHNQPDCTATVTVNVYDLMGRPVWTGSEKGRSDMFLTSPVNWDLCDSNGRRVPRGIYIYSATITTEGLSSRTASHKLAVTAQ